MKERFLYEIILPEEQRNACELQLTFCYRWCYNLQIPLHSRVSLQRYCPVVD